MALESHLIPNRYLIRYIPYGFGYSCDEFIATTEHLIMLSNLN